MTIVKPAKGLLKDPKPPGTIIEQLVEEVRSQATMVGLRSAAHVSIGDKISTSGTENGGDPSSEA